MPRNVTTNSSDSRSAANSRRLLRTVRWALRLTWSTNAPLTAGMFGAALVHSLAPAALALTARGLVNTLLAVMDSGTNDIQALVPWLALGLTATVMQAVSHVVDTYVKQRLYDELNVRIALDIMKHAAGLDVAFFEDPRCQDMLARVQGTTARYFTQFVTNCLAAATNVLQVVALTGILTVIEPRVTLLLIPLALPYLVFQWRLARMRYEKEYTRATKRRWTRYFLSRLTSQRWVPEVKLLGLAPLLLDRFGALIREFRDEDRRIHMRGFIGNSLFVALSTTAFYLMLARIATRVLAGALTVGDVAIYGGATTRLRSTLQNIVTSTSAAREQMLYISNLIQFLQVKPRIATASGLKPTMSRGAIEFENVSFTYLGSSQRVLSNVSFRIEPGETVALVGENGAGKTTLAKLVARLYDPTKGCILLDGVDLQQLSPAHLHQQIGFVFQQFGLYEATAADNIAYGDWERLLQDRERLKQIARLANVHDMIEAMPQGYDTFLGRAFGEYTLSRGQWQRMAVARAFARESASLLILDEPTSNLDARAEYELFCNFRELAAGRTTILISHRFSTVSMADRILVMAQGRIIEQGNHQELLAQSGHYATLYRLHKRQMDRPGRRRGRL